MGIIKLKEILEATGGKALSVRHEEFTGVSTDSRTIKKGELFIALKGDRFDGHHYVMDALNEGSGAIVSVPPAETNRNRTIIYVKNTLSALHDIAHYKAKKLNIPVISITGTNGKTTTKEMVVSIMRQRHKVLKTEGNLNNHIGLPLSVLKMEGDEDIMVLEMGSSMKGDIKQLCEIVPPEYALVTNVAPAHLEGFGSLEAIRDTDLEVLEYAKVVCVNADDHFLVKGLKDFSGRIIRYAIEHIENADIYAKDIEQNIAGTRFLLCFKDGREMTLNLKVAGRFNVLNALAAASVADAYGAEFNDIKAGLESFTGVPMRLEIKEISGMMVILDAYNANPASMEEAIKELVRLKKDRAIAVLGDMLELGNYSFEKHKEIVSMLSERGVDIFIAVGDEMARASSMFNGKCYTVNNSKEAGSVLLDICMKGDTLLIKGSRGMRMEKVLNSICGSERDGAASAL